MKTVINSLLVVAIVVIAFFVYRSIEAPIEFGKEKNRRYNAVVQSLKDIRAAQVAYRAVNGKYCSNFDSLIYFIKTDSFSVVRAVGTVADSLIEEFKTLKDAEKVALERGYISRDTIMLSVKDSLFSTNLRPNFNVDNMRYIPFTDKVQFIMGAGEIKTGSNVVVQVFEAKVPNHVYLNGLDEQMIINLNEECDNLNRYRGLKVGSLEEATNNAGNWE